MAAAEMTARRVREKRKRRKEHSFGFTEIGYMDRCRLRTSTRYGRREPPKRGISPSQVRPDRRAVPETGDRVSMVEPERPAKAPALAHLDDDAVLIGDTA